MTFARPAFFFIIIFFFVVVVVVVPPHLRLPKTRSHPSRW
jgi:hypothetical protein